MTDHRIAAVGVVSPINIGRARREGAGSTAALVRMLDEIGRRRTAQARSGHQATQPWLPDSPSAAEQAGITDIDTLEAIDYYQTPRGAHQTRPTSCAPSPSRRSSPSTPSTSSSNCSPSRCRSSSETVSETSVPTETDTNSGGAPPPQARICGLLMGLATTTSMTVRSTSLKRSSNLTASSSRTCSPTPKRSSKRQLSERVTTPAMDHARFGTGSRLAHRP